MSDADHINLYNLYIMKPYTVKLFTCYRFQNRVAGFYCTVYQLSLVVKPLKSRGCRFTVCKK
jgi:hypothetical protein